MSLPEMNIRLEIDGEVVKVYHLTQPYTASQRRNVIANMYTFIENRDFRSAYVVLSPVYGEKTGGDVLPIPYNAKKDRNYTRNDVTLDDFVNDNLDMCRKVHDFYIVDADYRISIKRDECIGLVDHARKILGYSPGNYSGDILMRLMRVYKRVSGVKC